jgi:hypothetical protein
MVKEHHMYTTINCLRILFKIYFNQLLTILATALISLNIFAQKNNNNVDIIIKGSVSFKSMPVPNAAVLLQLSTDSLLVQGTLTDSLGSFSFHNIRKGKYYISVQALDYNFFTSDIFSVDNLETEFLVPPILLNIAPVKVLSEVTVKAKKPWIEKKPGEIIFNIENTRLANGGTAWDLLQKAPAVKADELGNIRLRANQGAAIMINNKMINLEGEDLVSFLRTLNSEQISRIELITNPSSKYDAEGSGGIINIVTKRNQEDGLNGTSMLGYQQSAYAKYNAGVNLNFKHKNLTISGNYNYKNAKYLTREYLEQEYQKTGLLTIYDETLNRHRNQVNPNYKLDLSYAVNKKSTIGIFVDGKFANWQNNDISETPIYANKPKADSTFLSHILIDGNKDYLSLNANYKSVFDTLGKSLNIDVDYLQYNSSINSLNVNEFIDDNNNKLHPTTSFRSEVPQMIKIYTAKLDYSHPLDLNTNLGLGVKINKTTTDNNYGFENLVNNNYINDTGKSNHFIYEENIAAIYGNFSKTLNTFTFQAGLRGEYTKTKGNSLTLQNIANRSYFKLFPSVCLQQKFSEDYQLEFNYSKSTDRPSYADMNPFRYYSTPYSYSEGNPFLQPAYTHSFSLDHTFKNKYIVSLYYYVTTGQFTQVPKQNNETKTIGFYQLNLDKSISYGMSVELPFEVGNWWQSYNSIDISHQQVSSEYLGSVFSNHKMIANVSSTQTFNLSPSWSTEINGTYQTSAIDGLFYTGNFSELSLTIKRKLFKDKATLGLHFSDILRGTMVAFRVNYLDQKSVARNDDDLRSIRINFSYRFGKSKNKQTPKEHTSNEEERNRVDK